MIQEAAAQWLETASGSSCIQPGTPDPHTPTRTCDEVKKNPSGRRHLTSFLCLSFSDSAQCPSGLISGLSLPLQPEGASRPQVMGNGQLSLLLDSSVGTWKGQQFPLLVKRFFF